MTSLCLHTYNNVVSHSFVYSFITDNCMVVYYLTVVLLVQCLVVLLLVYLQVQMTPCNIQDEVSSVILVSWVVTKYYY